MLAFSLTGRAEMPPKVVRTRELPEQPEMTASAEVIATGKQIYGWECAFCHGKDVVARVGGGPTDLRYANSATHAAWHGIVVGGDLRAGGMPAFELSVEDSEAVRAYVLSQAAELRSARAKREP